MTESEKSPDVRWAQIESRLKSLHEQVLQLRSKFPKSPRFAHLMNNLLNVGLSTSQFRADHPEINLDEELPGIEKAVAVGEEYVRQINEDPAYAQEQLSSPDVQSFENEGPEQQIEKLLKRWKLLLQVCWSIT